MKLTIVLRKTVADQIEAELLTTLIRQKLQDRPDVEISASTSEIIPPPQA